MKMTAALEKSLAKYILSQGLCPEKRSIKSMLSIHIRVGDSKLISHRAVKKYESMEVLSRYVIEKGLSVLKDPAQMIPDGLGRRIFNDQILVLEFLNKYGNFQVTKAQKIKYKSGGSYINPCLQIRIPSNSTIEPFHVLLLNKYEWNGNPVRLLPFTKFSHYKGTRKNYMLNHYSKLRKLRTEFVGFRGNPASGLWCTRNSKDTNCNFSPVNFKNKCI